MKMKKCKYCGTLTESIPGWYHTVCDDPECNEEDRQAEIERAEEAREAAAMDGYSLYGGPGPDHF